MKPAFWIAIAAAIAVVLAHIGLFWWFIVRKNGNDDDKNYR
jgi:hypothetical protein